MHPRILFITTAILGLAGGFWFGRNPSQTAPTILSNDSEAASTQASQNSVPTSKADTAQFYKDSPHWQKIEKGKQNGDYVRRYDALSTSFREWAKEDPAQALAAALQTPEAQGTGVLYPIFSLLVKREGFESAMARLEAAPDAGMKHEGYRYLAQEIFQTPNPQTCMELLLDRSPKEAVSTALDSGLQSWRMVTSQDEVWAWVQSKQSLIDPAAMPNLERAVAAGTIDKNPEKGAAWLLERATDASRPGHLRTIAERWARNAPNAAGKWLKTLPPGPQNDEAIEAFVGAVCRDDPESAAHWATTISDQSKRQSSLNQALSIWRGTDAAAANAFELKQQNP